MTALLTPSAFEPRGKRPPPDRKPRMRLWMVRHAAAAERLYAAFEAAIIRAAPLIRRIGDARLERPVAALEAGVKGFLFDCRMCGDCVLSKTGMSCPMNCPRPCATGRAAACAPMGVAKSIPRWTASGSRPMREASGCGAAARSPRSWGRSTTPERARRPGSGSLAQRRRRHDIARAAPARHRPRSVRAARRPARSFVARQARARASARRIRRDRRAQPAQLGRRRRSAQGRRGLRGLGRRHQRHRRLGGALPHVEYCRLRHPDPHRLFAGAADLLPRL